MLFRISFLFAVAFVFTLNEGYAGKGGIKPNGLNVDENIINKKHLETKIKDKENGTSSIKKNTKDQSSSSKRTAEKNKKLNKSRILLETTKENLPEPQKKDREKDSKRKNDFQIQTIDLTRTPTKKKKFDNSIIVQETEQENLHEINIVPNSSLEQTSIVLSCPPDSPTTIERKVLSPIRREFALLSYRDGFHKKAFVDLSEARRIYKNSALDKYLTGVYEYQGIRIARVKNLFDPYAEVLTDGVWITNLERMKRGLCPIGHKGIVSKEERETLSPAEIYRLQKRFRIELHHMFQNNSGPLLPLTHAAHMGLNARLIMEMDSETDKPRIVYSSLEKEKALELRQESQVIVTNLLHYHIGDSAIDKEEYNLLRPIVWKTEAEKIEAEAAEFIETNTLHVIPLKLFDSPVKQHVLK